MKTEIIARVYLHDHLVLINGFVIRAMEVRIKNMLDFEKYEKLLDDFENLMIENHKISDVKLGPDKWTLKEMVGHLIDSASNNHQRFMRLQIENEISFPAYEAEEWVSISNIQNLDYNLAVKFWRMYNDFLLNLIKGIKPESMKNIWMTMKGEELSLEFLINDYYEHMKLHFQMFVDRKQEIEKS